MQWTESQKTEAIQLVAEFGLAHAWRETGIPKPTLVRWCKDAGVERFHPEQTRTAIDALQARAEMLRESLRLGLLEKAEDLLERMDAPHTEFKGKDSDEVTYPIAPASAVQNYATSAAILIDKHLLMSGEATGRTESVSLSHGLDPDAQRRVREWLASIARGEGDRGGTGDALALPREEGTAAT